MRQQLLDSSAPDYVGKPSRAFLSTYWPIVRSTRASGEERQTALEHLVRQYSPALKQYLRTKFGLNSGTADDFVQGFLVDKVLKRDLIARAEEGKGKFRTFLVTAIYRWTIDQIRREKSGKRSPENGFVGLDIVSEAEPTLTVEDQREFDNVFVRQVLATAVHGLSRYCCANDMETAWTVFYRRVLSPALDIAEPTPYPELVTELNLGSVVEARNLLVSAKRIFRRQLESVVTEYSNDSAEVEAELTELRKLLR
jgi:RNA polymerase sigma-70 factor (ECF subfamily)